MPKSTGEDWFGAPAAARYLGLGLVSLYKLIDKGELPAYQIGRVIRLRRVEVDDFIERSRVRPGELDHLLHGSDAHIEQGGRLAATRYPRGWSLVVRR